MVLKLKELSEDDKIRLQAEARADYDSRISTARGAGFREGFKQGEERGKEQAIMNLVRQGVIGIDVAAEQLGITEQELVKMLDV